MEQFLDWVNTFASGISLSAWYVGIFVVILLTFLAVVTLTNAMRNNENAKRYRLIIDFAADQAATLIKNLAVDKQHNYIPAEWEELAGQFNATTDYVDIDPRMYFVVNRVQDYIKRNHGVNLNFIDVLTLAENMYQRINRIPDAPQK